jgi:peptidoglycan L-alanyl-D-glutamate endopeptidase CwlK
LKALEDNGLTDKEMVLVALALVRADIGNFEPKEERKSRFNTSPEGHPFDLYDNKRGNQGPPDGERFKGRGYLFITGRAVYKQFDDALGLRDQLISNPDLANEPDIAARIMVSYLKSMEPRIRKPLLAGDLKSVRYQWSGGAGSMEVFTRAFQTGAALLK